MYLKSLTALGFKSFADKTTLNFQPGITAIVGPNGCGKSNVADSLRWVLGEQSAKALRGGEMADVIFNGTDRRKPLGIAEVSVTIGDVDQEHLKAAGIELTYNEVTITRRVFRDGGSEYFINKTQCRLKDIQQLFMGTGVGRASYSIMAQGHITQLLSSRPEDRRLVFEEAAGITRFKSQKREALRKLESTDQNLLRLDDLIREVKRQIGSLQRQAGKARRYKQFQVELQHLETQLTRHQFDLLNEEISQRQDLAEKLRAEMEGCSEGVLREEEQMVQLRGRLSELDQRIAALHRESMELKSQCDQHESRIRFNEERLLELEQRNAKALGDIAQGEERHAAAQQELEAVRVRLEESNLKVENLRQALGEKREALQTVEDDLRKQQEALRQAQAEAFTLGQQLSRARNEITALEMQKQGNSARLEKLSSEKIQLEEERLRLEIRLGEFSSQVEAEKQNAQTRRLTVEGQQLRLKELQAELARATREADELLQQQAGIRSKLNVLEQLQASHEGLSAGALAALRQSPHLLGTLVDRIRVPEKYVAAVEAALGHNLQLVLTEQPETARLILTDLRTHRRGRASIAALSLLKEPAPPASAQAPEDSRALSRAELEQACGGEPAAPASEVATEPASEASGVPVASMPVALTSELDPTASPSAAAAQTEVPAEPLAGDPLPADATTAPTSEEAPVLASDEETLTPTAAPGDSSPVEPAAPTAADSNEPAPAAPEPSVPIAEIGVPSPSSESAATAGTPRATPQSEAPATEAPTAPASESPAELSTAAAEATTPTVDASTAEATPEHAPETSGAPATRLPAELPAEPVATLPPSPEVAETKAPGESPAGEPLPAIAATTPGPEQPTEPANTEGSLSQAAASLETASVEPAVATADGSSGPAPEPNAPTAEVAVPGPSTETSATADTPPATPQSEAPATEAPTAPASESPAELSTAATETTTPTVEASTFDATPEHASEASGAPATHLPVELPVEPVATLPPSTEVAETKATGESPAGGPLPAIAATALAPEQATGPANEEGSLSQAAASLETASVEPVVAAPADSNEPAPAAPEPNTPISEHPEGAPLEPPPAAVEAATAPPKATPEAALTPPEPTAQPAPELGAVPAEAPLACSAEVQAADAPKTAPATEATESSLPVRPSAMPERTGFGAESDPTLKGELPILPTAPVEGAVPPTEVGPEVPVAATAETMAPQPESAEVDTAAVVTSSSTQKAEGEAAGPEPVATPPQEAQASQCPPLSVPDDQPEATAVSAAEAEVGAEAPPVEAQAPEPQSVQAPTAEPPQAVTLAAGDASTETPGLPSPTAVAEAAVASALPEALPLEPQAAESVVAPQEGAATPASPSQAPPTPRPERVTALSVIECDVSVRPLLERLLADTLIVADLADALEVWMERRGECDVVTWGGDLLSRHGVMTGGAGSGSDRGAASLLGRKNQIIELQAQLARLQEQVGEASRVKGGLQGEQTAVQASLQQEQTELRTQEVAIATRQGELKALENSLRLIHQKIDTVLYEIENLAQRDAEIQQRLRGLTAQAGELELNEATLSERLQGCNADLEGLRQDRDTANNNLTEVKVTLAAEEQMGHSLDHQQHNHEQRLLELAALVEARRGEIASMLERRNQFEAEIQESRLRREGLEQEREQVNARGAELMGQRQEQEREIAARDEALRVSRHRLTDLQQQRGGVDVELAEKRLLIQNLREKIQQKYQLNLDDIRSECITITLVDEGPAKVETLTTEEMAAQGLATDWAGVARQVADLQQKLDEMGPVNLVAIEEYEETEQRFQFLNSQHQDLVKAKEQLLEVINKINTQTQEMFTDTFNKIRENFAQLFTEVFGGGKADLLLVNEGDVLESGIDIMAKPPGKQLKSISLLSGGEQTMTAVSLLFAIYQVKPSPFCVLDELDAPLDESNINRFIGVLKRFLHHSQFIIITHNKRTIGMADVIYGVTMQEHGVSRLVGMKFHKTTGALSEQPLGATPGAVAPPPLAEAPAPAPLSVADAVRLAANPQAPLTPIPAEPPPASANPEPPTAASASDEVYIAK